MSRVSTRTDVRLGSVLFFRQTAGTPEFEIVPVQFGLRPRENSLRWKEVFPMNDSWKTLESLIATPELPGLGPTPRPGRLPLLELNERIDRFFADTNLRASLQAS